MKDRKALITGDMIAAPAKLPKPPVPEKKVINFRIPADFDYRLRRLAVERRMNLSELLIAAVDAFGAEEFK